AMPARVALLAQTRHELMRQLEAFVDGTPLIEGCICGDATGESSAEALQPFEDADDLQVMVRKWLGENKLDKLARLWVKEVQIDWALLYAGDTPASQPRRISLPTYPFAKERYGWPENHAVVPVTSRPVADGDLGGATASAPRPTASLSGTLLLQPVWEPVVADARQGNISP